MDLIEKTTSQTRKYLLFSSVGQFNKLDSWLNGRREYDIWLTQYTEHLNSKIGDIEFYNKRKGAKFPNLYYAMKQWPEKFAKYVAIWVVDDDIAMSSKNINKMFKMFQRLNLKVAQPAFDPLGKISYRITIEQPKNSYRFTNFVEVTCPIVSIDTLNSFMKIYDPELVGYGIDWWLMNYLGDNIKYQVAIFDCIRCHNPSDVKKAGVREIDRLQPAFSKRHETFTLFKQKYGIHADEKGTFEFKAFKEKNILKVCFRYYQMYFFDKVKRRIRWFLSGK